MRGLSGLSGLFGFRFVQPNRRTGPNRPEQPARSRAARATVSGAGGRFFHPARRARLVNRATLVSSRFPSESRLDGFPLLQQGPYGQQGHAKTGVGPMSCAHPQPYGSATVLLSSAHSDSLAGLFLGRLLL